jgi:hypothetical protein
MEFPTSDVIGAKQNTFICYFFLVGRCFFVVCDCDDILFVAQVFGLGGSGAHCTLDSHME